MKKDRMSLFEPAIHESFGSDLAGKEGQPSYVCVTGSSEFHRQALWHQIEEVGHAVYRFTEDRVPLSSFPTLGDDRHTMTIPLIIASDKQGVLHLERRQGTFTEAEFQVLSTVGTSLALALRNADTHR